MPSNKETLFQEHICTFLKTVHKYRRLSNDDLPDKDFHFIENHLIDFITETQSEKYKALKQNYKTDTNREIIQALRDESAKKSLWLIMRDGLTVRGARFELYKPKPRSNTDQSQAENYAKNIFAFKKEYRYNPLTQERIDLVIWLNGLPIIVIELKHEDEGQNCEDAIYESFVTRNLSSRIFKFPFTYFAASNMEVKVATNPNSEKNFRWFNAQLVNQAETLGEYPIEYFYRDALAPETIAKYLEHFLVFVPAVDKADEKGVRIVKDSFTIFPRYHQLRACKKLADNVKTSFEEKKTLGNKFLINHSAGSGKTLTIAWMADLLDSLYTANNEKIFDNIIILTDRRSLDKNVKDDLEKFGHLSGKIYFTNDSGDLAKFLELDRDIIVSTIHKFSYIQDKLKNNESLKKRRVAFLIDEAHRSQEGKMALSLRKTFTADGEEIETEAELETEDEKIIDELQRLDTSNQIFVAFTATTTPKTVSFFGEPFDTYTEDEAIQENYILDVAQNIVSYKTLYHLKAKAAFTDKEFPATILKKMLRDVAFNDEGLIQYKSELIIKFFEEKIKYSIGGKAKAMVVASSRLAGLKYFNNLKTIIEQKKLPYKVLFAFSDFNDPNTNQLVEETKINKLDTLHGGKVIEDVFDSDEYRILVVANKFQTGFDQPLLSAMFLDKTVSDINAIQTVSRLNRKHPDKEQADILVVDFTNNSDKIFSAFNRHRKGSPHTEKEPSKAVLQKVYDDIQAYNIFTDEETVNYVKAYIKAETEAKARNSNADALLSNINQTYRTKFKAALPDVEKQKEYIGLLRRYAKLYYFIAQFFELEKLLNDFIVFAEVMSNLLIKQGKISELTQLLKNVNLSKGAVEFVGQSENPNNPASSTRTGTRTGTGNLTPPKATIEQAIEEIKQQFQISDEDAIVITEICEEVSNKPEIKQPIIENRNDLIYLRNSAKPRIKSEITSNFIRREMYEKLTEPIYVDNGGIISLMGEVVIKNVLNIPLS
jgi:type I restriction enzyme, R subunit